MSVERSRPCGFACDCLRVGNFYKNLTLFGPRRDGVIDAVRSRDRTAFVSPTERRFTVVYDRDADPAGEPDAIGDLSLALSTDLDCAALAAAVYDDDVRRHQASRSRISSTSSAKH